MGQQLLDAFPTFRSDVENFNFMGQKLGFPSFIHLILNNQEGGNIDQEQPIAVQLATTAIQIALARLLKSFGIHPNAVTGHSLGMYAALQVAGVLSAADILFLIGKRAQLLQVSCQQSTHSMLAIKASQSIVTRLLADQQYEIACVNSPDDLVNSGANTHIDAIRLILVREKITATLLRVSFAFHSAQVEPIMDPFRAAAAGLTFHPPTIPVLCPLTASTVETSGVFGPDYLARHCRETVDMAAALRSALNSKVIDTKTFTMEIGPHPVVCGMVRATLGNEMRTLPILQRGVDVWPNLTTILQSLYEEGLDIDWGVYHMPFSAAKITVALPSYGWDLKSYWIAYENDWCTYKPYGRRESIVAGSEAPPDTARGSLMKRVPQPETSTVHRMIEEKVDGQNVHLVYEGDLSRTDIRDLARGHIVNGIPFTCPSWLADMALVVGKYALQWLAPDRSSVIMDVAEVVADKVLVPHGRGSQLVRVSLSFAASSSLDEAKVEFYSVDANGNTVSRHGSGVLRFADTSQFDKLQASLPDYLSRIQRLRIEVTQGDLMQYNKRSGYRLISQVADFGPDYKLLDDLVVDEDSLEATCTANFTTVTPGGTFAAHPGCIDAITQLGGFAVNARASMDLAVEVFISHGWLGLQLYEELKTDRKYELYVQMQPDGIELYRGDTIILDRGKLVGFIKGVTVRRMPRKYQVAVTQSLHRDSECRPGERRLPPSRTSPQQLPPASLPFPPVQSTIKVVPTVAQVIGIISEESGISRSELTDDSNFADMGIDSLCSMVIGSRLREDLHLDLATDFSIFVNCPTLKQLKDFLITQCGLALASAAEVSIDEEPSEISATSVLECPLIAPSPPSETDFKVAAESSICDPNQTLASPAGLSSLLAPLKPKEELTIILVQDALKMIAEESGLAIKDLTDDSDFADIGVDSLCSMVIQSRLREELHVDLEANFSIITNCPTVGDFKVFLMNKNAGQQVPSDYDINTDKSSDMSMTTPTTTPNDSDGESVRNCQMNDCRPATSVILQGIPAIATKILFLLPDGSGSATSYTQIPRLSGDVAIVGINCPYVRDPEEMKCTPAAMVNSYCLEIVRRQPKGPYYLGGWSAGGPFAFACACVLTQNGEAVDSLIIIDAPVPSKLGTLPVEFYEYCGKRGLFSSGSGLPPAALIPHFLRTMETMLPYQPSPLQASPMPHVGLIWACETVMDETDAPNLGQDHFMLKKRLDFGPDGWDRLLPGARFTLDTIKANHFTMMQKEHAGQIRDLIDRVLSIS